MEWGITEAEALAYCYSKGFRWGGLYEHFQRVSCYCCPLARMDELYNIYKYYPELWANMLTMDKKSYRSFKSRYTLEQLVVLFEEYY